MDNAYLDLTRILDLADGDEAFVAEVLAEFSETAPYLINCMQGALAGLDSLALQSHAHDLKGSSRTVGALKLAEASAALEANARAEQWEACGEALRVATECWEKTATEIQSAA